ncbi:16S rRNA (cytidine(1402)-2'-O)-methyltransferase [Sphingopyxis sp. RIFCSPHIGHO2_12_FULL_65_19]|uniref:16S rRNA (cytidine(1402)-2'-O)-methyltransferase n=1 Tax=Sphingopyxis sp. RIFCSPHIGHO2_12_FULL_65_19 TaxID=1802172 RepID=UPI0008B7CEF8|nr:16S rRNA (cytidine(1402)-2'-O)-methyltransferase [Sphingopyxis sp. RIFCSPHIGHO2_12_FULL_65_19]OHD08911.1 MAG: 16S rRNA (cytidine(1402)-2'-O)-methyltransferase [Sphingopyxis sp. RIFCSPHIGHO2_12_FULL_65_19]
MPDSTISNSPLPGLYIVATPIGNLGDISARAAATIAAADVIAAEDTRITAKLLSHLGLRVPMTPYHDHSDERTRTTLVTRMADEVVVLVSDAGTPLISDPGYKLVRDARAAGRHVTTLPGPCAAIAAITLSGLPSDRFLFAGFLPNKAKARADTIAEFAAVRATLIFYESGPRLAAALTALADGLGNRDAAVAREISKMFEECVTGTLIDLAARYGDAPPKGEIVVIVGPPGDVVPEQADDATLDGALRDAMADRPVAQAAKAVAKRFGLDRHDVYARALTLKEGA